MAQFDRRVAAGLVAVLIVTGCSDGDTSSSSSSAATVGTSTQDDAGAPQLPIDLGVIESVDLRCEEYVVATDPPDDFDVVLDAVALPASPPYPNALQTSARTADDGTVYYFAKTGLSWTGEQPIELEVPEELRPTLAIGWGGPAQPSHAVRLNCAETNGWTARPGDTGCSSRPAPRSSSVWMATKNVSASDSESHVKAETPRLGQATADDHPVGNDISRARLRGAHSPAL